MTADGIDLGAAAERMAGLLANIRDEQLTAATPCAEYTLGDLIDHVGGLSVAFTWAAEKDWPKDAPQQASGDSSRLPGDWRREFADRLTVLAEAWREPAAWEGMTRAGGFDLPAPVCGRVALNELVVHGWDVARASGQDYQPGEAELAVCTEFVSAFDASGEGPFGKPVPVPADAPALDRLVGGAGRDPSWSPS